MFVLTVCLPRTELLKVHTYRLLSFFKMAACQQLIVYKFSVKMQYFDLSNIISSSRISDCLGGGNLLRHSACPQHIQPLGANGRLLISNTVLGWQDLRGGLLDIVYY